MFSDTTLYVLRCHIRVGNNTARDIVVFEHVLCTMTMLRFFVAQAAITSLSLGALKYHNAISIKPEAIKNDTVRYIFNRSVYYGEALWRKGLEIVADVQQKRKA